jgi:hypothetical protein
LERSKQAPAQEAARTSVAGETAAEARRKTALGPDEFSLLLGPSRWVVAAGLDLEANDNICFDSNQAKADLIVRPQVNTRVSCQITDQNSVNLAVGTGYSAYAQHPEFNRLFVSPGSELSLDLYAGDFWINLHERLLITENAYDDPTVVGTGNYSQLQNTAGLTAIWDLNKLVLRLGYDHINYALLTGGAGFQDGDSDVFAFSAGHRLRAATIFGVELGKGLIRYRGQNTAANQEADWNIGTFVEAQPSEYLRVKAGAGYTVYAPESSGAQIAEPEFTGVYARLGLNHQINRHLEYSLSGGRSINFGFFGGTIDLYTAVLEARWHLFQKLSMGTAFEFEYGSQVWVGRESFERFGPRLSLERSITAKMSGALRYQYYSRQSDVPGGDYVVNIVTFSLAYRL